MQADDKQQRRQRSDSEFSENDAIGDATIDCGEGEFMSEFDTTEKLLMI